MRRRYVNVITGKTVVLDHPPVGEAWQRKDDPALARRLIREERAKRKPTTEQHEKEKS